MTGVPRAGAPRAVLDASAALHLVMAATSAEAIAEQLESAPAVSAPDLFTCEVANALWKYVRNGDLSSAEAATHLDRALALPDTLVPGRLLAHEALYAAATYGHSVYDLMYGVLARRQGAAVITLDAGFARLLHSMRIEAFCPGVVDPRS